MEMFKKFGTGQARVLVALPSPCTPPAPLFPSALLSSCTRLAHMDTMLAFVLAASVFPAQSAALDLTKAFQDQALPVSLQLHHRFT